MTIRVNWHNDSKTIIQFAQGAVWTWEEFDEAVDRTVALMNTVSHRVDVIVDMTANPMPPDMHALGRIQRAQHMQPRNFGQVIVVSQDPFMARVGGVFIRVFAWLGSIPQSARSYGEAERLLERARSELLPLL
jgi:hypothetical protein